MGDGKTLRMVTTDGHRLSKTEMKVDRDGFYNFTMIIPNKGIMELKRLLDNGDGVVNMGAHEGSVFIKKDIEAEKAVDDEPARTADFVLVSKLIESDFPPYDQIIPEANDKKVVVNRLELLEALKRVSVVSSDRTLGVKFSLSEGRIDIATDNPSIGEGTEPVDVDYDGEEISIGFNARYLIEVLGVLGDEEITLEMSGNLDPTVVKDEKDTFVGVVMPMKI
jgi:DNA polymerase-3 subunit beta